MRNGVIMDNERIDERISVDEQNKKMVEKKIELYRHRYSNGLDLWTGEPLLLLTNESSSKYNSYKHPCGQEEYDSFTDSEMNRMIQKFQLLED